MKNIIGMQKQDEKTQSKIMYDRLDMVKLLNVKSKVFRNIECLYEHE